MSSEERETINMYRRMAKNMDILLKSHNVKTCAYCGAPAEDREHVVPYCYLYPNRKRSSKKLLGNEIVWSCRECNILAGANVFNSFDEKKQYILDRVLHRYRKILSAPEWTERELGELGGKLKVNVFLAIQAKKYVLHRIENLKNEHKDQ